MLDAVRDQSERFWSDRQLHTPDWWERLPLIPFRELCAEELSQECACQMWVGAWGGWGGNMRSIRGIELRYQCPRIPVGHDAVILTSFSAGGT